MRLFHFTDTHIYTQIQYLKKTASLSINTNRLYKCIPTYVQNMLFQKEPPLLYSHVTEYEYIRLVCRQHRVTFTRVVMAAQRGRDHISLALPVGTYILC